jgi:hypothetical protein
MDRGQQAGISDRPAQVGVVQNCCRNAQVFVFQAKRLAVSSLQPYERKQG